MTTRWTVVPSPLDELLLARTETGLCGVWMTPHPSTPGPGPGWTRDDTAFAAPADQLAAYFAGELTAFDLPLDLTAGSTFQQQVWTRLRQVPYGTTTSYGEVATALGLAPGASRAVGLANGRNPLALVVPCHRVVGGDGSLTGYAGGLARKRWLLTHEGTHAPLDGSRLF